MIHRHHTCTNAIAKLAAVHAACRKAANSGLQQEGQLDQSLPPPSCPSNHVAGTSDSVPLPHLPCLHSPHNHRLCSPHPPPHPPTLPLASHIWQASADAKFADYKPRTAFFFPGQ